MEIAQTQISALNEKLDVARRKIDTFEQEEKHAAISLNEIARWTQERREDSMRLWFPDEVKQHFQRFGIPVPAPRFNTSVESPDLPELIQSYWRIALPVRSDELGVAGVLFAAAQLEKNDPFVRITGFKLSSDPENPLDRIGSLNITTWVRK